MNSAWILSSHPRRQRSGAPSACVWGGRARREAPPEQEKGGTSCLGRATPSACVWVNGGVTSALAPRAVGVEGGGGSGSQWRRSVRRGPSLLPTSAANQRDALRLRRLNSRGPRGWRSARLHGGPNHRRGRIRGIRGRSDSLHVYFEKLRQKQFSKSIHIHSFNWDFKNIVMYFY